MINKNLINRFGVDVYNRIEKLMRKGRIRSWDYFYSEDWAGYSRNAPGFIGAKKIVKRFLDSFQL